MKPNEAARLPYPPTLDTDERMTDDELNTLARLLDRFCLEAYSQSKGNGFWDDDPNPLDRLCLVAGEIAGEAADEIRNGHAPNERYYRERDGKPEGFGVELADGVVRIADSAGRWNVPLGTVLVEKHRFNTTRPFRHGKVT